MELELEKELELELDSRSLRNCPLVMSNVPRVLSPSRASSLSRVAASLVKGVPGAWTLCVS